MGHSGTSYSPRYADLPLIDGGARSAWALYSANPSVGRLALQTEARVAEAAQRVAHGRVFPLDAPLNFFDPPLFGRAIPQRKTYVVGDGYAIDDVCDQFYPQAVSQWDALGHVSYRKDVFFGGATEADVLSGRADTIDYVARRGIAGRALLIDVWKSLADQGQPASLPGTSYAITVDDLERARREAGATYAEGDILLIRTGYIDWYSGLTGEQRRAVTEAREFTAIGLENSEEIVAYLWDSGLCAVVADCPALMAWPPDHSDSAWPFGDIHRVLLAQLGIFIGELWWLEDLARDCWADGSFTAFLVSAPLHLPGAVGSTANAIAIK